MYIYIYIYIYTNVYIHIIVIQITSYLCICLGKGRRAPRSSASSDGVLGRVICAHVSRGIKGDAPPHSLRTRLSATDTASEKHTS